jgi:hypothetical protein
MLFRGKLISMPHFSYGGPLFKDGYLSKQIQFIKDLSYQYEVRSFSKLSEYYSDKKVGSILGLKQNIEEQWSSIKSKRRSQINSGYRHSPLIKVGKGDLLKDFYKVYSIHMHQLGSPSLPFTFFKNLVSCYEYGEVNIVGVYFNGACVSAGFKLSYMGFEEVCWASTLNEFSQYNFNMLLYWEMIKNSINQKNKYFSFGRSTRGSSNQKFKKQWEPLEIQLYFNYSKNIKQSIDLQKLFSPIIKCLPLPVVNMTSKKIFKYLY